MVEISINPWTRRGPCWKDDGAKWPWKPGHLPLCPNMIMPKSEICSEKLLCKLKQIARCVWCYSPWKDERGRDPVPRWDDCVWLDWEIFCKKMCIFYCFFLVSCPFPISVPKKNKKKERFSFEKSVCVSSNKKCHNSSSQTTQKPSKAKSSISCQNVTHHPETDCVTKNTVSMN